MDALYHCCCSRLHPTFTCAGSPASFPTPRSALTPTTWPWCCRGLPALQALFADFGRMFRLGLDAPKTALVPLDPFNELDFRRELATTVPQWGSLGVAGYAKYLGFYLGPDRGRRTWGAPVAKYAARARIWKHIGAGAFLAARAYDIFVASVLLLVAQLDAVPLEFAAAEQSAFRALFPGPRGWMTTECLKNIKDFHMMWQLKDLLATALAAKAPGGPGGPVRGRRAPGRAWPRCANDGANLGGRPVDGPGGLADALAFATLPVPAVRG
ncbi:unnamed protein product [Prorocentrum cordatum]|uniref:Uncharacterized protein n=1 Tax=Prorocentrum cordatum TaxID=2364126 RepID=A0ABN9WK61_9DINO|nr:unnamed protein product [Polarella glacialis]